MELYICQTNKTCTSFLVGNRPTLVIRELGSKKAFSNLKKQMETTMTIPKDRFIAKRGISPLDDVRQIRTERSE